MGPSVLMMRVLAVSFLVSDLHTQHDCVANMAQPLNNTTIPVAMMILPSPRKIKAIAHYALATSVDLAPFAPWKLDEFSPFRLRASPVA